MYHQEGILDGNISALLTEQSAAGYPSHHWCLELLWYNGIMVGARRLHWLLPSACWGLPARHLLQPGTCK